MWGTPALVEVDGHTELVISVPFEIWGMDPETGKMLWYCEALSADTMCSSLVVDGTVVYAVESGPGPGGGNSRIAVRAGGKGDVTRTHVVWTGRESSRIGTPVAYADRLYGVTGGGVVNCINAKTGERIYQSRLGSAPAGVAAGGVGNRPPGRPGGGGFAGGPGGFGRGQSYSSPVIADGKLYYVRRSGEVAVIKLGDTFEQLATNRFDGDGGDFSASPAISDGELFIRSSKHLYCVATTPQS
jgi:outer membrane protein assembly factor BamB